MYAKIKAGTLIQYPYGYAELQADNPYTNFTGSDLYENFQGTEANLSGETLEAVFTEDAPSYNNRTQRLVSKDVPVFKNGRWTIEIEVVDKTAEELQEQENSQAANVRADRNARLAACDWTQLADAPVDSLGWANYRQALRDVPQQADFPWEVVWPKNPFEQNENAA